MKAATNLAEVYRNRVRIALNRMRDDDMRFRAFLENEYQRLKNPTDDSASRTQDAKGTLSRHYLYTVSLGLFTLGRLDVVQDILDGLPAGPDSVRRLALALKALMPMPLTMDLLTKPDDVRDWWRLNQSRLEWNVEKQAFEWIA